jgi:hypothetical protein
MKLSQLLAGATALALAAGMSASAMAATASVTFNVTGNVNESCLISFTNTNMPIGTIPIDTTATDPVGSYFHMTSNPSSTVVGQGGCNANNTVTITKGNGTPGLHNPTTAIYDPTQFTANLDYNAEVGWTGPYGFYGSGQHPNVNQGLPAGSETATASITNGAFASSMDVTAYIFTSPLALLAGTYSDTITVTLTAS